MPSAECCSSYRWVILNKAVKEKGGKRKMFLSLSLSLSLSFFLYTDIEWRGISTCVVSGR
jgi:hypothetical protein